jgi:hypothetical protein
MGRGERPRGRGVVGKNWLCFVIFGKLALPGIRHELGLFRNFAFTEFRNGLAAGISHRLQCSAGRGGIVVNVLIL